MIKHIAEPVAFAVVRWLPSAEGGRSAGPPTAPVYAATCVFPLGDDHQVHPGWPQGAEQFSVLLEEIEQLPDGGRLCKVGFLAPDLAWPHVRPGAEMLIMEGPKTVATAIIRGVADQADDNGPH